MKDFSFVSYAEEQLETLDRASTPKEYIDVIEFCTGGSPYMREILTPFQGLILKIYYGLWERYPFTEEEEELLDLLEKKWGLVYDLSDPSRRIAVLLLAVGRRGTKSTVISYILTYEAYKLIQKGDPQKYYEVREDQPIKLMQCASAGKQAKDVFELTSKNLKNTRFFDPYFDARKDTQSELRIFTPSDIKRNKENDFWNTHIRKQGTSKRKANLGSIVVECVTTSAATHRGGSIMVLVFDEFAHFDRAKYSGQTVGEAEILAETPQSDYAMYKALTPSVKDFGEDGKIICISSPKEKGGRFYELCASAGTIDQDPEEQLYKPNPRYLLVQLATWEARPTISEDDLQDDAIEDPIGFQMEYGAHFGNPAGAAIDPAALAHLVLQGVPILLKGKTRHDYIIAIDPAKGTTQDTYAIAWGHSSGKKHDPNEREYWIDGYMGFQGETVVKKGQVFVDIIPHDEVLTWMIETLVRDLGRDNIVEIVYDQWQDMTAVSILQKLHLPACETFFSNSYKDLMYRSFIVELNARNVHVYEVDESGKIDKWVKRAREEMKHLQRETKGQYTLYHHPSTGPVQTDDFADVTANVVYRLKQRDYPTAESVRERKRETKKSGVGAGPVKMTRYVVQPLRGASLPGHGGITSGTPRGPRRLTRR